MDYGNKRGRSREIFRENSSAQVSDRGPPVRPGNEQTRRGPMTAIAETAPATDRELVLTRIIDAPREKLFRAWTDA
jgi:hypothetical protein